MGIGHLLRTWRNRMRDSSAGILTGYRNSRRPTLGFVLVINWRSGRYSNIFRRLKASSQSAAALASFYPAFRRLFRVSRFAAARFFLPAWSSLPSACQELNYSRWMRVESLFEKSLMLLAPSTLLNTSKKTKKF